MLQPREERQKNDDIWKKNTQNMSNAILRWMDWKLVTEDLSFVCVSQSVKAFVIFLCCFFTLYWYWYGWMRFVVCMWLLDNVLYCLVVSLLRVISGNVGINQLSSMLVLIIFTSQIFSQGLRYIAATHPIPAFVFHQTSPSILASPLIKSTRWHVPVSRCVCTIFIILYRPKQTIARFY